ncbi:hypothetical protein NDU88_007740 [Pleurodeles waltl]|uniref:Uncharacterized protein n=1 Tax=Pleurodeles waltl TaxID=8319 RepID=A0AAV7PQ78_PLEWA|nr:hypothetical protein NDU88_007740 [Pleurodeles waltl]
MDADGGESETSRVDSSEQDVRTHSGECVENQVRPRGITPEGWKGDDLAETLEPGMGQERAMRHGQREIKGDGAWGAAVRHQTKCVRLFYTIRIVFPASARLGVHSNGELFLAAGRIL